MKIACLQYSAKLGKIAENVYTVDALLAEADLTGVDLLCLPELALTGYNFPSLSAITPFLEPTASGVSAEWARKTARKLSCIVHIGYPETTDAGVRYNSTVTISPRGETLAHYRKAFLYYSDELWAAEGPTGFFAGKVSGLSGDRNGLLVEKVAMGICMDINPYRFSAAWDAFEFANHVIKEEVSLVMLSMAWLSIASGASPEDVDAAKQQLMTDPLAPSLETISYWAERLKPLVNRTSDQAVVVIIANRTGVEGDACYAGSSTVMQISHGVIKFWDILGRGEERCLLVDTQNASLKFHPGERNH